MLCKLKVPSITKQAYQQTRLNKTKSIRILHFTLLTERLYFRSSHKTKMSSMKPGSKTGWISFYFWGTNLKRGGGQNIYPSLDIKYFGFLFFLLDVQNNLFVFVEVKSEKKRRPEHSVFHQTPSSPHRPFFTLDYFWVDSFWRKDLLLIIVVTIFTTF